MLAPRVSRRVAALVASILSIERKMSVMRPAKSRAVACGSGICIEFG